MSRTPLRELVEERLGRDVCGWVRQRQRAHPGIGWRTLADELETLVGRKVSHMSLAAWCRGELDEDEPHL